VEIKSVTKKKKNKNKKNKKQKNILAFLHRCKMAVTWLYATF